MRYTEFLGYSLALLVIVSQINQTMGDDDIFQLEDVVVSANRNPVSVRQNGSSVTVITREDIENRQIRFVTDLLRTVPGLSVSQSGNTGSQSQIRIRGNEANHTLVLIDGIEVSDVGNGTEFDFGHLMTTNIDRIEIIRGPQSALFGSDAIGGVINIITNRGSEGRPAIALSGESGSFQTQGLDGSINTRDDWYSFSVFGSHYKNQGTNIARQGDEKDGYKNLTIGINGQITPRESLHFDIVTHLTESEKDFDRQDFRFPTTPTEGLATDTDDMTKSSRIYGRVSGTFSPKDSDWKQRIGIAVTDSDNDSFTNRSFSFGNEGQRTKYDYQITCSFDKPEFANSVHNITIAYEYEEIRFQNIGPTPTSLQNQRRDLDQDSFIGEYHLNLWETLSIVSGIRFDDNERFDDIAAYRLAMAYSVPDSEIKFHGSLGTGSNNPTFTELFGFYPGFFTGNPSLEPEKSQGFDIGIEKKFKDGRFVADIVYFNSRFDDKIVSTFRTVTNAKGESQRQGIEFGFNACLTDQFSISGSYTYTDAADETDREEIRRSPHTASMVMNYIFLGNRATINVSADYIGDQTDIRFFNFLTPSKRVTLNDHVLVNLVTTFQLTKTADVFIRIKNLLNEDYENVFSFSTPGISVFSGLRLHY